MSTVTFSSWFAAQHPKIPLAGAQAILALAEGGATVPFIARYRKEQTGNLDEVAIRQVLDAKERWDAILKRQAFIVEEIERQRKLTPELEAQRPRDVRAGRCSRTSIFPTSRSGRPRPRPRARPGSSRSPTGSGTAATARIDPRRGDAGGVRGRHFRNAEKGFADAAAALAGAQDILIERLAEDAGAAPDGCAARCFERGYARTRKGEKAKPPAASRTTSPTRSRSRELLKPANSHRYLAMRRGWMEEELVLSLGGALARRRRHRSD